MILRNKKNLAKNTPNKTFALRNSMTHSIENLTSSEYSALLHPQGYSRASAILKLLPFGSSTLWAWSGDGRFPAPYRISSTMTAWKNSEVITWLEQLAPTQESNNEVEV